MAKNKEIKHTHCLNCNELMPESLPPYQTFCCQPCYVEYVQEHGTNVNVEDFCKSNKLLNTLNNEYN